jgi:hypothetical protein
MRLIALLLYLIASYQNKGLEIVYDQSQHLSIARSAAIEVKLNGDYITKEFILKVQFVGEGIRFLKRPENGILVFRTLSHRWRFLEESDRQVIILIDGEKSMLVSKPKYASVFGDRFLEETLQFEIRTSEIEKLAKASNVEIKVGSVEGKVKERQLTRISDLLNALPKQ